jgi:hypothetical protein
MTRRAVPSVSLCPSSWLGSLSVAIEYTVGAEELHVIGAQGAKRIRTWLDSTYRFRIDHSIYDLDQDGKPYMRLRVPQLQDGKFERFDLVGNLLNDAASAGRTIYVECKEYTQDGNQGVLYDEYLAVCYTAFVAISETIGGPADIEFMWATTHPFAVTTYTKLTTGEQVASACKKHAARLADREFDQSIADQVAGRLWLSIVNERVEEMMMGVELRKAVAARIVEMAP